MAASIGMCCTRYTIHKCTYGTLNQVDTHIHTHTHTHSVHVATQCQWNAWTHSPPHMDPHSHLSHWRRARHCSLNLIFPFSLLDRGCPAAAGLRILARFTWTVVTQHEHHLHFDEQRPRGATPKSSTVLMQQRIYVFFKKHIFSWIDRQTYRKRQSLERAIWCEINIKILIRKLFFFFFSWQEDIKLVQMLSNNNLSEVQCNEAERKEPELRDVTIGGDFRDSPEKTDRFWCIWMSSVEIHHIRSNMNSWGLYTDAPDTSYFLHMT